MHQKCCMFYLIFVMSLLSSLCYGASDFAKIKCYASQVKEDPSALYDGCVISNSNDHSIERFTWWPNKGSTEWVQYQFLKQMTISWVEVYWFDDMPNRGKCRVPQWWLLQYQDREDMQWKGVEALSAYGTLKDGFNKLTFKPVKTDALRMVIQLQDGFSGGILEWNVEGMRPPNTAMLDNVKSFRPQIKDRYYPSEEPQQFAEFLSNPTASEIASAEFNGKEYRVLEKDYENWGLFAFVDNAGDVMTIRRSVGDISSIESPKVDYPQNYMNLIMSSKEDILGNMILEGGNEPSFEDCAGFLPEIEGYTFLSNEYCEKSYGVSRSGQIVKFHEIYGYKPDSGTIVFSPYNDVADHGNYEVKRGLIGNYLPAIDYGFYDNQNKIGWELIAFANTDAPNPSELEVYIYLKIDNKKSIERKYYKIVKDNLVPCDSSMFFSTLLKSKSNYEQYFSKAMEIDIPDQRVIDVSKASLIRAFITYHNANPKYGVSYYGFDIHDAFPPTTISLVNSCIEWNLHTQAAFYLNYFFDTFVKENGSIDYYGPSDSEYGQLLDVVASYVNHSKDTSLLTKNKKKIFAIINQYLTMHRQSKIDHPQDSPYCGLIKGAPEADTREAIDYYYAGNMWLWRGWVQISRVMEQSDDDEFKEMAKTLQTEAESLRKSIIKSINLTINKDTTPAFIPPTARVQNPFVVMTENLFASYTNYRYYPEMLSSDFLPPSYANAIIDYRRLNGGELMGMTRFVGHLDDWPMMNHSYALLVQDRVESYLLAFYADMAHHRMPGTFSAFEQVNILDTTNRTYAADYCVPAQLITPILARWMLVFEEKDTDLLWLCRAVPQRWLAQGQGGITVRRASTRWGSVNFSIKPNGEKFHVVIDLSENKYPSEIRLRIPMPDGRSISQLISTSNCTADIDTTNNCVSITKIRKNRIEITVQ